MARDAGREAAAAMRRSAILMAAGKLFMTKGFEGTTTLDIAREAEVSKRDLYAAFATKEDMLAGLVTSRVERMSPARPLGAPESRPEALATLAAYVEALLRFLIGPEASGLYRVAIATADRQPIVGKTLLKAGIEGTVVLVKGYVAGAVDAGVAKAMDVELAVRAMLAMATSTLPMQRLLDPSSEISEAQIRTQVERAMEVFLIIEARGLQGPGQR